MNTESLIKEILSKLLEIESKIGWSLEKWNDKAEEIYKLEMNNKTELPEVVWHYLSDADIRKKEPSYGIPQIKGVKNFICET